MGQMVCGAETTREDEIIYDRTIYRLITNATKRIHRDAPVRKTLENLVYKAIKYWEDGEEILDVNEEPNGG